jgi:diguanylate cyclase
VAPEVPTVVLSGRDDEGLAVQAVQEGAQDYLVKRHADGHLLIRAIRYALERKRAEIELTHQALHDSLTGLPNRTLFMDRLRLALARVERGSRCVAVLFLDLDRFKIVNDSLGHEAGDTLLSRVAERLGSLLRASDTVARFGGDEFVMLCDELGSEQEAVVVAERIVSELAKPHRVGDREIQVEASVGIAYGRDQTAVPEDLIRFADQAMFRAKQRGTAYELADTHSIDLAKRRLDLEAELRRGVERGEFMLEYQPQVDLRTQGIEGVEALLRWRHPSRGVLAPDEFIPAAEESALILPIGEWVIGEACRQLADWREIGLCSEELTMSVNLSPRQLTDPELVGLIEDRLRHCGVPADRICFEITESTVAADPARRAQTLRALKDLGTQLALDDFGTGVSSLGILQDYPVDTLKVDRSFAASLDSGLKARRIFAAVLGVAHALGLRAVAEGIESREQLRYVASVGCDAAQGFHLGRPQMPAMVGPTLNRPVARAAT